MKNSHEYKAIGLMSGTSLDGLDIAAATFRYTEGKWDWKLHHAETIAYPAEWASRLRGCMDLDGLSLSQLHIDLGAYFGECVAAFMEKFDFRPDLLASHGHTVFHQPEKRLTWQVGAGTELFARTGIPVVCDFRSLDVALGGQGAPLVPVGDRHLFTNYDACLNLGGIANISYEQAGARIAYDICPCNMTLNRLAARTGREYDDGGALASQGTVQEDLLRQLEALSYYQQQPPKSLGLEEVEIDVFPLLEEGEVTDLLRTSVEHTAQMIVASIRQSGLTRPTILVTGGGALNEFLIQRMRGLLGGDGELFLPDVRIISYKEALVFAFLGVLRATGEHNVLSSVTGSRADSSSGIVLGQIDFVDLPPHQNH